MRRASAFLLVALAGSCTLAGRAHDEAWATPAQTGRLDDVTAGLAFNDGSEGDVRGRTENFFEAARTKAAATGLEPSPRPVEADRLMIYRGTVAVEVARVEDAIERFVARAREWGGYLSSRQDAKVTVRVPARHFPDAMAELRGCGRVLAESMQAEEVTRQHLDLTIRLENARKGRDRLLALLEKAAAVEDILKIEEQLRRLTEEIERLEGELKYLNDQVAMSTVTAAFQGVAEARTDRRREPSRFGWINAVGLERLRRDF